MIVIMNESFADFRKLGDIQLNQNILENWDALTENVVKGYVSVPIFGGWTANSEFEFLTGFSNAFFPSVLETNGTVLEARGLTSSTKISG